MSTPRLKSPIPKGRVTNPKITQRDGNWFVYGSNESGINGAGSAFTAETVFDARPRMGFGPTSKDAFAIPTKSWFIKGSLPLSTIEVYVWSFIRFAKIMKNDTFNVTEIGCGHAGYTPKDIAPFFRECVGMKNVNLPEAFWEVLLTEN